MDRNKVYKYLKNYDRITITVIVLGLASSLVGYVLYQIKKFSVEKYNVYLNIGAYIGIISLIMIMIYGVHFYLKRDSDMKAKQEDELRHAREKH